MLEFLQTVLTVVGVIVVLLVLAWWLFKRWIGRLARNFSETYALLEHVPLKSARIRLRRAVGAEPGDALKATWQQLSAMGFRKLGEFEEREGQFELLFAGFSPQQRLAAAVWESSDDTVQFAVFSVSAQGKVRGRSNDGDQRVQTARLDWLAESGLALFDAVTGLTEYSGVQDSSKSLEPRMFRAVFEQAYAVRMDRELARPPDRDAVVASIDQTDADPKQLDAAYDMVRDHWIEQVSESALDHYRRSGKIDAATWEDLRDELHVVHAHLDADDIRHLIVESDADERIFDQCVDQGLSGLELYDRVQGLLEGGARMVVQGEVSKPLRAVVYGPADEAATRRSGEFLYRATDGDGKEVHGAVFAMDGSDAKAQLRAQGLTQATLLLEPTPFDAPNDDLYADPRHAKMAAQVAKQSLGRSLMMILAAQWWIWGPPAALLAYTIYEGPPLGWGDYVVIVYMATALAAVIFLIGPTFLYSRLQLAFATGRWERAESLLNWLDRVEHMGVFSDQMKQLDRCKIMAGKGQVTEGLEAWEETRGEASDEEYHSGLVQIHDYAGNTELAIKAQRKVLELTDQGDMPTVDLALSLARAEEYDEAEELIGSVHPDHLVALVATAFRYVRGMIAAGRGQHERAIHVYKEVLTELDEYIGTPLMLSMVAEVSGYLAVSLIQLGMRDDAARIWQHAKPMLEVHRSQDRLVATYTQLAGDG